VDPEIATAVQEKQHQDEIQFAELARRGASTAPVKTNADGGMHPVFVEAVKRNQVGVAPASGFLLASQAPGTIPTTVRPPRIPELSDAAVVTGTAVEIPGQERHSPDRSARVRTAAASASEPTKPAEKSGLFGNWFSSGSDDAAAKKKTGSKNEEGAIDRMARLIGLRGSEPDPEPVPAPKSKPAAKPPATARTKPTAPAHPEPARPAEPPRPVQVAAPVATPAPVVATASAQTPSPPTRNGLSGAAPVVPAGTFDARWSAFR
jgi:hypothetical protein